MMEETQREPAAQRGQLKLTIHRLEGISCKSPFVRGAIGQQKKRTKTAENPSGGWDEVLIFDVTIHACLFFYLLIDVHDVGILEALYAPCVGSVRLPVSELIHQTSPQTKAYKLEPKYILTASYESKRNSVLEKPPGSIVLTIEFCDEQTLKKESAAALMKVMQERVESQAKMFLPPPDDYPEGFGDDDPNKPRVPDQDLPPYNENEEDEEDDETNHMKEKARQRKEEPSFFQKMKTRIAAETAGVFQDLSVSEERQSAWFTFNEMLLHWSENLGMAETLIAVKLLESYYESQRRPLGDDFSTRKQAEEAVHYYKYALAVFGWRGLAYCRKFKKREAYSMGDMACIKKYLNLGEKDMIKFHMGTLKAFEPCHFVIYDETRREIIVSIRGTMSVNDALVDGVCEYGPWGDGYAHKGFAWATNWLFGHILSDIITVVKTREVLSIVSVGHSLGGAVASFFAITMHDFIESLPKDHPLYGINVLCHAYGAPPIISASLVKKYDDVVSTYVNNEDVVPSLSFGSLMDCRSMILMALDQHNGDTERFKQIMSNSTWVPNFVKSAMNATEQTSLKLEGLTLEQRQKHPKLYQPGKIYHIRTDPFMPVDKAPRRVATEIIDRRDLTEIKITSRMIYDHLPDEYEEVLQCVLALTQSKE